MKNPLKKEKVYIQYVRKNNTIFEKAGNPASGGLHDRAIFSLTVPTNMDGSYKQILTPDEVKFLTNTIGTDLSFTNKTFWSSIRVGLKKDGVTFDLSDPMDYIRYKVVEAWSNTDIVNAQQRIICPSPDKIKERKEYKFCIVKPDEISKVKRQSFNKKKEAYMLIGKHEKELDILRYLYYETTPDKRIASDSFKADDLLAHFDNLIETNPAAFLLAAQNEYLETKAMLFNAYCKGIIKMSDKQLWFSDKKLAEESEEATLDNAAKFINHPARQTVKFSIESLIDEAQNK